MLCRCSSLALLTAVAALAAYGHYLDNPSEADNQKCAVEGTAVDASTSEALRKATIELAPWFSSGASYRTTTDQSGRFSFHDIPPGDYWLRGVHTGYLEAVLGSLRYDSKGTMLRLAAGATLSDLQLKLARASIVSGKVLDDSGEPVVGVLVDAYQGHFSFTCVPPGKYYAFAAQDVDAGLWENRDFFEQVRSAGVEVNVAESSRTPVQVKLLASSDVERALTALGL